MFTKIKKIWKDPVGSKVIASAIIALVIAVLGYLLDIWLLIYGQMLTVYYYAFESTVIPNWLLISFLLITLAFVYSLCQKVIERFTTPRTYKSYLTDEFDGILWTWEYFGKKVGNLSSLCPKCQHEIIPETEFSYSHSNDVVFKCEECGFSRRISGVQLHEYYGKINRKIQREIRTGAWAKKCKA